MGDSFSITVNWGDFDQWDLYSLAPFGVESLIMIFMQLAEGPITSLLCIEELGREDLLLSICFIHC